MQKKKKTKIQREREEKVKKCYVFGKKGHFSYQCPDRKDFDSEEDESNDYSSEKDKKEKSKEGQGEVILCLYFLRICFQLQVEYILREFLERV